MELTSAIHDFGAGAMAVRSFSIAVALAAFMSGAALAQFEGMPSWPGVPQAEPHSPLASPPLPAACQQLLTDRDDTQKHGQALKAAGEKKAPPDQICKLFNAFLPAESKMLKGLEENRAVCGVPAQVIDQVRAGHSKASQIGKQVCEVAARGERTRPLQVLDRAPERPCEALWARLSCPLDGEN
jgi:hypothetical protein